MDKKQKNDKIGTNGKISYRKKVGIVIVVAVIAVAAVVFRIKCRNILMSTEDGGDGGRYEDVFGNADLDRRDITSVTFLRQQKDLPDDAWDVSKYHDGSVKAWVDGSELYIAGKGIIKLQTASHLFYKYENLEKIQFNDAVDASRVKSMWHMFWDCSSLTSLDLSSFDTSNVTNMEYMFLDCTNLTNLDLSSFDTSNVTFMDGMFEDCSSLTSLDLSSFDTSNVTNMEYMFLDCTNLINLNLSSFDTSNVTNMDGMFKNCSSLTSLNLSSFNISQVTGMEDMFDGAGITAEQTGLKQ